MNTLFRLRVRYGKIDRLRWLSHLEVLRAIERAVRRSGLPYAVTQGFNPHMRLAFGPALPVGTAGESEYVDLWLDRYVSPEKALTDLRLASSAHLWPLEAYYVDMRAPSLAAALTVAEYVVEIGGKELGQSEAQEALSQLQASGELITQIKGKTKVFDLTRCVPKDVRVEICDSRLCVFVQIRTGPEGSLRPEVLVRSALEAAGVEVTSLRTTRTDLLVEDEEGVVRRPV